MEQLPKKKTTKQQHTKVVKPVAKIAAVPSQAILKLCGSQQEVFPPGLCSPPRRPAPQPDFRALSQALFQKAHTLISSKRKTGAILTTGKSAPLFPPHTPLLSFTV